MNNAHLDISPRPELDRFIQYKPGLSIEQIQRQTGLKRIIKLASNENPYGPSPKAMVAYRKVATNISRYPESRSVDLRNILAKKFSVGLESVIVGAGSDEIIELLAKAFLTPSDEVVVSSSSFLQYRIAADLMGSKVISVPMRDFRCDLKMMISVVTDKTKLVFIANPNNPTGTYVTKDEMKMFLSALPPHVLPVVDEAYFEYASGVPDYSSAIDDFFWEQPLVVLRTFSKAFGLAGLRVGFGVGPENIVSACDRVRPPFNVSIPAQAAGIAALRDRGFIQKSVSRNRSEKRKMESQLRQMGFSVIPSITNFLLFRTSPHKGRALFEKLLQKGVIVRAVDEYGLFDYLRVTVGTPQENKIFIRSLKEVINEK